ncbi:MAG: GAF domain-containing protein, partial [Candidatus Omnitrophica bacterium]|nr:GAF domain-containing protein [Candidatus Omnitrophota bacterium]
SLRAVVRRAIEHIRLQRENIQLREAVNLKRITEALGSTLELNEVLQVVLESALAEASADFGAVLLDCKDQERIRLAASRGEGEAPVDLSILDPLESLDAWREGSQKSILIKAGEETPFPCPLLARESRKSAMNVPLRAKGEFIGVLHVAREICPDSFTEGNLETLQMIAAQATFAIENASLYDNLHHDYMAIIRALANAVEAKDPYTRGHGDRVVKYTQSIGRCIGLDEEHLEKLKVASILHDIGKIGIRDQVLLKPGPLTDAEYSEMKLHPIIGDRILEPIRSLKDIRMWIYQHHERLDGKGYPEGIGGDDLVTPSRLLIVAEVFDALVTERAYKPAWSMEKVINFLRKNADTHFDREMSEVLIQLLQEEGESFYKENVIVY